MFLITFLKQKSEAFKVLFVFRLKLSRKLHTQAGKVRETHKLKEQKEMK